MIDYENTTYTLIALLWLYLFYRFMTWLNTKPKEDNKGIIKNPIVPIESNGLLSFDKEKILSSDMFKSVQKEHTSESYPAITTMLKEFMIPYGPGEYFKIHKQLRTLPESQRANVASCYKQNITASAILFKRSIPKSLYTNDTSVLVYCSIYLELIKPIDFEEQLQLYIKNEYHTVDASTIPECHSELQTLIECLDSLNSLLVPVHQLDHCLQLEHLYNVWLSNIANSPQYLGYYKGSIINLKKLLTLYYGILQMPIPQSYFHFTPAIVDYILQSKRYSLSRISLAVSNDDNSV
jgi:hypothetical protein